MIIGGHGHPAAATGPAGGYAYDVFISYRRLGTVRGWVQTHFARVLDECLADHLDWEPRVFLDIAQEPGTHWRRNVRQALTSSRLLVAVWSPLYFRSDYCVAEWRTMVRREQVCGLDRREDQRGLVYPIRYSDGDSFPREAREVQYEDGFQKWRVPEPQFSDTAEFIPFRRKIDAMAERLAPRLAEVPEWCPEPEWPVEFPDPEPPPTPRLPRL